ncbi:hypothetical protein [Pseudoalteromonas ruthenica]|uniref:hypothetical protein n=1 Tax=Pseudoalteromonas ruthenica TaxID=151081 RepID=UPI00034AF7DD|nr:hypothetical protein [Pseudoalteromonas ruthenica]
MRWIFLALIGVSAGALLWIYLGQQGSSTHHNATIETAEQQPPVAQISIHKQAVTEPKSSPQSLLKTPAKHDKHQPTDFGVASVNKVSKTAQAKLQEAGVIPTDLRNEAYVEFDLSALRALEAGDTFELMIPQTQESFVAEVNNVSVAENGDRSVFGAVTGAGGRFHTTVLTVGKDAVYGQLTAPSGNYVFESKNEHGWIAAKRDLYRQHQEQEVHASSHQADANPENFNPQFTTTPTN